MATKFLESILRDGVFSSPESAVLSTLMTIGLSVVLRFISKVITSTWTAFFRPGVNVKSYGQWALVTGATDGIGKSFAKNLAKSGLNLILVSRSEEKLTDCASELEKKYGIETKIFPIDLTSDDLVSKLEILKGVIESVEVGILVNNAGMSYPYAQFLHEIDDELITKLIRINVEAVTRLTKLVLSGMISRKKGAIVNIGSGAASVLPADPLYAVYAGTKGFVDQFSKTLDVEYKGSGIDVQCQAPLYVATKLSKIRFASLTCPSADTFGKYGVRWIGRETVCTPYPAHGLLWWIVSCVPVKLMNSVRLSQNLSIRKRALAKEAKKKEQ